MASICLKKISEKLAKRLGKDYPRELTKSIKSLVKFSTNGNQLPKLQEKVGFVLKVLNVAAKVNIRNIMGTFLNG